MFERSGVLVVNDLPVPLGGVAAGHPVIDRNLVEGLRQRLGGVRLDPFGGRLGRAGLLEPELVLVGLVGGEPALPLVEAVGIAHTGRDPLDLHRLGIGDHPERVFGVITGHDAPQRIAVGVIVDLPKGLRRPHDQIAPGVLRLRDEADIPRRGLPQFGQKRVQLPGGIVQHLGAVLHPKRRHHFLPSGVLRRVGLNRHDISAERRQRRPRRVRKQAAKARQNHHRSFFHHSLLALQALHVEG